MRVFRIALTGYSQTLVASGRPARWNTKGRYVIYTAGSAALACLENLAHRSGADLTQASFSLAEIDLPDTLKVREITREDLERLHPQWHRVPHYPFTQALGEQWLNEADTAILKIPSAIIASESNYLLNPQHPDFNQIRIYRVQPFTFDERLA